MKNEMDDIEVLISMVMDLVDNPNIKNGKVVRTLMYCISMIAIRNEVDEETLTRHLLKVHKSLSVAIGSDLSWLPPAES